MMRTETVPEALAGERVDRVVSFITGCSRAEAASLVEAGSVRRNDVPVRKGADKVATGDIVTIDDEALHVDHRPVADPTLSLTVLFSDTDVVVVDKPAAMVVHPGAGTPDRTLVNALLHRFPDMADVGEPERPGIVHRLDRGTSGVLVVARSPAAYTSLTAQLGDRSVERRYLALASGRVESEGGVIDARLGRSKRHPTRQAVVADGREARTHYEVQHRYSTPEAATLLRCRLETGRTHQIRVHLAAIGHPVIGDETYGHPSGHIGRPALHAQLLGFTHPISGERLRFESPVPDDLAALVSRYS